MNFNYSFILTRNRSAMSLCRNCEHFEFLVYHPNIGDDDDESDIRHDWKETPEVDCELCGIMKQILSTYGNDSITTLKLVQEFTRKGEKVRGQDPTLFGGATLYLNRMFNKKDQKLKPCLEVKPSLDLGFAKRCLQTCNQEHHDTCSISPEIRSSKYVNVDILLIDLENSCLIEGTMALRYAALSYVWGSGQSQSQPSVVEMCTVATLPQMRQEGYFADHHLQLPPTIRDSMDFCRQMDCRYLWIDRLCIPQDLDYQLKMAQLDAMGVIYHLADFTIVAAEGDVSTGIYSLSRNRLPNIYDCHAGKIRLSLEYDDVVDNTKWSKRGWTFQEQTLSRRCFIFRRNVAIFLCQSSIIYEDRTKPEPRDGSSRSYSEVSLLRKRPDLSNYQELLQDYTRRALTYPCDSLDAVLGILRVLEPAFPSGFYFGLPEIWFDVGLLWQSTGKGVIKDRKKLALQQKKPIKDLPSWSWLRWEGNLDFEVWHHGYPLANHYTDGIYAMTLLVTWWKLSTDLSKRRTVQSHYDECRQCYWERGRHNPMDHNCPNALTSPWYVGASDVEDYDSDSKQKLLTPLNNFTIAVEDLSEEVGAWSSKIAGRVQSFKLIVNFSPPKHTSRWSWLALHKISESQEGINDSSQVGVLRIHDDEMKNGLEPIEGMPNCFVGQFIALSIVQYGMDASSLAGWEDARSSASPFSQSTMGSDVFFNVMLIEWLDGYAERRGLGRVPHCKWGDLKRTELDIILG
jgi:hypothetical protein